MRLGGAGRAGREGVLGAPVAGPARGGRNRRRRGDEVEEDQRLRGSMDANGERGRAAYEERKDNVAQVALGAGHGAACALLMGLRRVWCRGSRGGRGGRGRRCNFRVTGKRADRHVERCSSAAEGVGRGETQAGSETRWTECLPGGRKGEGDVVVLARCMRLRVAGPGWQGSGLVQGARLAWAATVGGKCRRSTGAPCCSAGELTTRQYCDCELLSSPHSLSPHSLSPVAVSPRPLRALC